MKDINFYWFEAFNFTIGAEIGNDWKNGGYTNNPLDPGGETKYGICKRAHPNEDIKNLTIDRAKEIYYKNYWLPSYCQELIALNFPLTAIVLFDTSINCGCKTAKILLQKAIGVEADGMIGKQTVNGLKLYKDLDMCNRLLDRRKEYYDLIISKNIKLGVFKKGWYNRINNLRKKVEELNKT